MGVNDLTSEDQFNIENGILKAYTGTDHEIVIPVGVDEIGDGAFKGLAWIAKVTMPGSVKRIGNHAFKGCRKLKEIVLSESLCEVGEYAFHRCHDLEELIFPASMTKVGSHAFLYCDSLKKVVIEGPKKLPTAVFSHNMSLREIAVNEDVDDSNFGDEVFEGCITLKKISLSGKTYDIGNLIEVMDSHSDYPGVIKSVAKSVFHALRIEDRVLTNFNINLKKVTLPEGIVTIGKSCFFDKKGIVSITLPKSVCKISANAFLNCFNLEEIVIQNEELTLDEKAFRGCCNLRRVVVSGREYSLETEPDNELASRIRDQVLGDFYISGNILVRYLGNEEQVRIPGEVKIIGERCFFGKECIKTVICPGNLLEIREQAFEGCLTLQTVEVPGTLKRIEREAFAECKKLYRLNIPKTLEYIGEYAFRRCFSLTFFDPWPETAKICPNAFYRAKNFDEITERLKDHEKSDAAEKSKANAKGSIEPYAYVKNKEIEYLHLSGVCRIGRFAYAGCENLTEVIIDAPECIIEREAFSNCPKLKKVMLNIGGMEGGVFSYCRSLEEVSVSGISKLPEESFSGCYSLRKFEASELTSMDARCFDECVKLDHFDFSGISVIGERAFERCDSLKQVRLTEVECGFHAFADCSGLETVEISGETRLGSGAFIGCTQIKNIIYNGEKFEFSKFSDGLNHVGNPYPATVREVIASIYSCFDIVEGKLLSYSQDGICVTVPADVSEIGQDVFRDHVRLQKINIPESVRAFGSHAFSKTAWLEGLRKESDVIVVNGCLLDGANCKGSVIIPPSVLRVASWSFAGNIDITELTITSEKTAIESLSFRNCLNLKKITDRNGKVYTLNSVSDLENAGYPDLIRRIFAECINCFKLDKDGNLTESTGNITKLRFPAGIRSIGEGVYKDCHLLDTIELSEDTVGIGKSAFENSKWLKSVIGAGSVEYIGAMAFSGCQSLENIGLSDKLCELGSRCFEHCSSLKEIKISDRLEKIPERAFFRCKSLKNMFIPDSVKEIETEAFAFCDGLTEVSVGKDTKISDKAFTFCDNVQIIIRR